ncbi:hypothetical protein D3C75_1116380 [compost metagenome]
MPKALHPDSGHKKEIRLPMPAISIACPYCGREDDHANIFEPGGDYVMGVGVTYCDGCEQWFDVILEC